MIAQNIVETLSYKGFSLWTEGGNLKCKPIPDAQTVESLRRNKAEIIFLLNKTPVELQPMPSTSPNAEIFEPSQEEVNAVLCPLFKEVDAGKADEKTVVSLLADLQKAEGLKDWRKFRELLNRGKELKK